MATLHKPDQILAGIMSIHPWVVVGEIKLLVNRYAVSIQLMM